MDKFLEDFSDIQAILSKPSGIHMIESKNIDCWINKMNPVIRTYGQMFKDNIRYIKWKDLLVNMEVSLHKAAKLKNKDKESIWLTFPGKSYHIFALIAYYYCTNNPELNVLLPSKILYMSPDDKPYSHVDYYIFDDISYSGTQAYQNMDMIMEWCEGLPSIEVYLVNCYITKQAYKLITTEKFSIINFKGHMVYGVMLESLSDQIGELNSKILQILFGPGTRSDCIIYADHKMADFSSTFMMTLQYGLVPPDSLDYKTSIYISGQFVDFGIYMPAIKHLLAIGIKSCSRDIHREWVYYPFINGCDMSISPEIRSYPYEIVLNLPALSFIHKYGWFEESSKDLYKDYNYAEFELMVKNRCPKKWY
jgi:hypothetical protein